jgi:hypothetical protein
MSALRSVPAPAILCALLPVPIMVGDEWWWAPAWLPLREVADLYRDVESLLLTALLAGGIIAQVALWTTLATLLLLHIARAPPHARVARACASWPLRLLAIGAVVASATLPVYRLGESA